MRFCSIDLDLRSSLFLAALGLLVTTAACRAEGASPAPPAKPPVVPTFEKWPHTPLPEGEFIAWCGDRERYLLATDGQYVDAYDGSTKISAPSPTGSRWVQCGADGKYINFSATIGQPVYKVVWAPDSSKFFVAYSDTVAVLDAHGKRIGGGKVRKYSGVTAGWFDAAQKSLFLFLVSDDIQAIGNLVRCRIADWRCVQLKERVEQAAGGGKGLMGIVSPLDRPRLPDDDSSVPYARYAAELRDDFPRYFARLFKARIVYEAYPESQAEVDEMITRLRLNMKVIYDP